MDYKWLFDRPIAHRGLHDENLPENSMPAYQAAIDNNYNIEIDVHLTKDKVLVVHHDDSLKRICGVDKLIKNCTLEEIKKYKLLNTDCTVPTFDEFLELVNGKVGILCEIKGINPFDWSIIKATIERCKTYNGNIALQSFNFGAVAYGKKHCDFLPIGELCTWFSPDKKNPRWFWSDFMGKMWVCDLTKADFIAYDVNTVNRKLPENKYIIKYAKKYPILFWTVDSKEKIEDTQKYANNMIFENLSKEDIESAVGTFNKL